MASLNTYLKDKSIISIQCDKEKQDVSQTKYIRRGFLVTVRSKYVCYQNMSNPNQINILLGQLVQKKKEKERKEKEQEKVRKEKRQASGTGWLSQSSIDSLPQGL